MLGAGLCRQGWVQQKWVCVRGQQQVRSDKQAVLPANLDAMSAQTNLNLPGQSTALIGRETELAEIRSQLADPYCRLLTLVGPGGIGKTRLAVEVAARMDGFADGIHLFLSNP